MTGAVDVSPSPERNHLVDELCEDLDVAIREFLERNPGTSPERIRSAMRLVEQRTGARARRRAVPVLALIAALIVGVALGLLLG